MHAHGEDVEAGGGTVPQPQTLAAVLERRRLPPEKAAAIAAQVAAQVAELHRAGRVHGAVHPETVLIDRQGRAVLLDPDVARGVRAGPGGPRTAATPPPTQADDLTAIGVLLEAIRRGTGPLALPATPTEPVSAWLGRARARATADVPATAALALLLRSGEADRSAERSPRSRLRTTIGAAIIAGSVGTSAALVATAAGAPSDVALPPGDPVPGTVSAPVRPDVPDAAPVEPAPSTDRSDSRSTEPAPGDPAAHRLVAAARTPPDPVPPSRGPEASPMSDDPWWTPDARPPAPGMPSSEPVLDAPPPLDPGPEPEPTEVSALGSASAGAPSAAAAPASDATTGAGSKPASGPSPASAATSTPTPAQTPEPAPPAEPTPTPDPDPPSTAAPTPAPTPTSTPGPAADPTSTPSPDPTSASTPGPAPDPAPASDPAPNAEPTSQPTPSSEPAPAAGSTPSAPSSSSPAPSTTPSSTSAPEPAPTAG